MKLLLALALLVCVGCGQAQPTKDKSTAIPKRRHPSLHELRTLYPQMEIWCDGFKDADCDVYGRPDEHGNDQTFVVYHEVVEESYTVDAVWDEKAPHPTPPPFYLKTGAWRCPSGTSLDFYHPTILDDSGYDIYGFNGDVENSMPIEPPKRTCTHFGIEKVYGITQGKFKKGVK